MHFDDILVKYIGEFGRYQQIQFFLVCLPTIFTAMHSLSWTFTGANVPFRCKLPQETMADRNRSFYLNNGYKSWLLANDSGKIHSCKRIVGLTSAADLSSLNHTRDIEMESCNDGYVFDHEEISYSAVEKWNFVCENSGMRAFIQSMYYVGQFIGSFVFGFLADRYGRKTSFFCAILLQILCGSLMAYTPWWPLFALLRIGVGFAHPGIFLIAVVIGMELVGPSRRLMAGILTGLFFAAGQMVLGTLAYAIRDYQHLQLAISLPALVFIVYWWLIPESARWLISQKRYEEADVILQKAARINKRNLPEKWYEMLDVETRPVETTGKRYGFADLFKTPNIKKRIIITSFVCWPAASMVYYGLSMNPNFLGGDRYSTFVIMGFFEVPALLIVLFVLNQLGRKLVCMSGFLIAGFSLAAALFIPNDYSTLLTMQVVLCKMALCAVYAVLYIFTPELFPTVIRSSAMGSCSMVARVGAFSASYFSMWLVEYSKVAVVVIFGSMCLLAGSVLIFLPETTGQRQFDSIEEAEMFGRKQPLFSFSWKKDLARDEEGKELSVLTGTDKQLLDQQSEKA